MLTSRTWKRDYSLSHATIGSRSAIVRTLSKSQCLEFGELGYLAVKNLIDPDEILDPVIEEYEGVLDRVANDLFRVGDISSRYEDLAFGERITNIFANSTRSVSAEETRDTVSNPISTEPATYTSRTAFECIWQS